VQTGEGVPALVHGGPFGNIAHGCNSVVATRTAAARAELVVTEAGFGFDLGAEKFFDLKCRSSGLWPSAVVLVVTARALCVHGGGAHCPGGATETITRGLDHLDQHVASVRAFGFEPVIALNVFDGDDEAGLAAIEAGCAARGLPVARTTAYTDGGAGAEALASAVVDACARPALAPRYLYGLEASPEAKIESVAGTIYGAEGVEFSRGARRELERIVALGYDRLPVCIAKTHLSLSDDPRRVGRPSAFRLPVESLRIAAGAGYLLALTGDIVTMPGLPREPAAWHVDLDDDGNVTGI
jgi:formate--tetrahydrofolate ligase